MNRRDFFVATAGGLLLSHGQRLAIANDAANRIGYQNGLTIDDSFGPTERGILEEACARFYSRFLQPYYPYEVGWGDAWSWVTDKHISDYKEGVEAKSIFYSDWIAMWRFFANENNGFPPITLNFVNVPRGDFVAQALYDTIVIADWPNDTPYTGEFNIDINDWYLNNGEYPFGSDSNYWAGVIAHECWHNLGHKHPSSRDDPNYYLYQMVLHEMAVMQDGSIRYGDKLPFPVYCRRHPG